MTVAKHERVSGPGSSRATLERIRRHLVGLRMPRSLEVLEHLLRQLERGEISALKAIDQLLDAKLSLREGRRFKAALAHKQQDDRRKHHLDLAGPVGRLLMLIGADSLVHGELRRYVVLAHPVVPYPLDLLDDPEAAVQQREATAGFSRSSAAILARANR